MTRRNKQNLTALPFGGGRGRKIDVRGKNLMPMIDIHFKKIHPLPPASGGYPSK
jgi:hypothetical protein